MLYNKTRKNKIMAKVKFAEGFLGRFKGLMFESMKNFDYALVFDFDYEKKSEASIHMMFVFFPIDAVYLDKNKVVVDVARNLRPFALNYTPKKKARFLVELPEGKAKSISIGNKLEWR